MFNKVLQFVFGSKYERDLKWLKPIVIKINSLEEEISKLTDAELKSQTIKFKERIKSGETLDDILPEAFATVREASYRTLGMRHFDVQMMGGIVLHKGKIAEMKTGEGKTLTSTLTIYLNALTEKGVHVVTVNDYLARRDANWMKPIYEFLGVSVGFIQHDMDYKDRQEAYQCDITYGTNNEFGFDYLRDNMVSHKEHKVQKEFYYAIVDEVDSILIDEARTPLIISGPTDDTTDKYVKIDVIIPKLKGKEQFDVEEKPEGQKYEESEKIWDYDIDEKAKNVLLTETGVSNVEKLLGIDNLYAPEHIDMVHHVHQALKAHKIFQIDVDYVVQDGEVIIVDEFTGRLMPGRRYSDGLHQALEAKERVTIAQESQTLASITFQNFFRLYEKLAGMTGTADTEAEEFAKIYSLDVVVVPSNMPLIRIDHPDRVYRTEREKFDAIAREIKECYQKKQPVLVGTISIEKSEFLSNKLKGIGIPHSVLNAKYHEKEAEIVSNAGKPGGVTIATNMAGRGTDIVLGGSPVYKELMDAWTDEDETINKFRNAIKKFDFDQAKLVYENLNSQNKKKKAKEILDEAAKWQINHNEVLESGGLHILGTERHEARRIDNQLRGRSGRQGDPGSSRFYLSLEDDLMRIFGSDRISSIMQRLGMEEGQEIEHKMVSNAIARSQKRVEGHNFDIRKHLLEYDDVMNRQRIFVYNLRNDILYERQKTGEITKKWLEEVIEANILLYCETNNTGAWNKDGLNDWLKSLNPRLMVNPEKFSENPKAQLALFDWVMEEVSAIYQKKAESVGLDTWSYLERNVLLDIIDHRWKEHLYTMDHLREGIWTVGYGDKNPLIEYKLQGFRLFDQLVENMKQEVIEFLLKVEVKEKYEISDEVAEYQRIGEENVDIDIFGGAMGPNSAATHSSLNTNKRKVDPNTSHSAGGSSERKSKRRRKR
ncbi:MAG: preprotein translocase subunit SecA [Leptospiraceae bacterium]|nr:preprotein translocase subunit SecA [Leptospiraceae bacterium]MCP5494243.1 preprotein translocase subunit SecA [Leptospiraceae bacterium]